MRTEFRTIPEGLDLISSAQGIVIRKVWLSWRIAPLALFAVIWDTFLFFWYAQVLSKPDPQFMAVFFPIGHVAVGVGLTYYVLAAFVNRTDVSISSSGVRVTSGPAPWFGNKQVKAEDLREIVVRKRTGRRGSRTFSVMYADRTRKERKLVSSLDESDQAEYIADAIREAVGLAMTSDQPPGRG